jgi:GT2 family glycosyltransferase
VNPRISVVIPVFNSAGMLRQCLEALRRSDLQPEEIIVVSDGSTDNSALVAEQHGAKVLFTGGRFGPARARNLGAKAAFGEILLFLDADVCVHPNTLSLAAAEFAADPGLDAVMGSYDSKPRAAGYLSQFRNLMHCFVHRNSNREAVTFWAGCGAMRREVFLEFGGFAEMYRAASIEDVELGYRMAQAGRSLVLNPEIQVTHLKPWSFGDMIRTDFLYRALPWSELSLRYGHMPNDLNLRISQRISVALSVIMAMLALYLSVRQHAYFLMPLLLTVFMLLSQYWVDSSRVRSKGALVTLVGILAAIVWLAFRYHRMISLAVLSAFMAVVLRHRYAYSKEVWRRRTGVVVGVYLLMMIASVWYYLPWHRLEWLFLALVLTLLMLNIQFYAFLAADRGKLFAIAAIPFHMLYFLSSGVAFALALLRHTAGRMRGSQAAAKPAPPEAERLRAGSAAR